jgi:hypothetical protein
MIEKGAYLPSDIALRFRSPTISISMASVVSAEVSVVAEALEDGTCRTVSVPILTLFVAQSLSSRCCPLTGQLRDGTLEGRGTPRAAP